MDITCTPQFISETIGKEEKQITDASFDSRNISSISSLVSFSNLMKLSLTKNNLESVSLALLPQSLQILNLSYNKINSITLAPLAQLKVLILNNNCLSSIPFNLPCTLKALVLSNNPLKKLNINPLPLLTKLSVSACDLSELPNLTGFDSLKQINANNNCIKSLTRFPESIEIIELANNNLSNIDVLLELKNLKNLNLKGNAIQEKDYDLIKEKSSIRVLDTVRIDARYHERRDSIKKTRLEKIQKAIGAIAKEIRRAKKEGDKKALITLLKEIKELEGQRDKVSGKDPKNLGAKGIKKEKKIEESKICVSEKPKEVAKQSAWEVGATLQTEDKVQAQPITVSKTKHTGVVKLVERKSKGKGVVAPFDPNALEESREAVIGGWDD